MGREVEGRFKKEGIYVYLWLIHVDVWQKPRQYHKAIILQLKKEKGIHLLMQGTRVQSLVQEDFTCRGATKPMHYNKKSHCNKKPMHSD